MKNKLVLRGISNKTDFVVDIPLKTFPGGEVNIRIPTKFLDKIDTFIIISVDAYLADSEGVMSLLMLKSAMNNSIRTDITTVLNIGYMPYARQDRICNEGEALSIHVFSNLINSLNFDKLYLLDLHNEDSLNYFRKVSLHNTPSDILIRCKAINVHFPKNPKTNFYLIAPDKGASQKVMKVSQLLDIPYIQAYKERDPKTGRLSEFSCNYDVEGLDLLIVDDICDGGGTFIGLTKLLYDKGANSVSLYVTHGIFSKGLKPLLDANIKHVYTSNSIYNELEHSQLTKIKW